MLNDRERDNDRDLGMDFDAGEVISLEPQQVRSHGQIRLSLGVVAVINIITTLSGAVAAGAVMRSDVGAAKEALKIAAEQQRITERDITEIKAKLAAVQATLDDLRAEVRYQREHTGKL